MIWLLLQAAAITLIVTEGSVFGWLRSYGPALWRQLWSCSLCLGTWVGMVHYVLHATPAWTYYTYWVQVLGFGCVSGCMAYTGAMLWAVLDRFSGPDPEVQVPQVVYGAPVKTKPTSPDPKIVKAMQEMQEKSIKSAGVPPHVGQ